MLPARGFFEDVTCPYVESGCGRPYCQFSHRKHCPKKPDDPQNNIINPTNEVPTYKPTPKSELARSHIPISYVPDLEFRPSTNRIIRPLPKFEKPTYKPTPISILSSANARGESNNKKEQNEEENIEEIKTIREIQQNIADVEYTPEGVDIDFEDLSEEFNLLNEIIDDPESHNKDEKLKADKTKEKSDKQSKEKKSERHSSGSSKSKDKHKSDRHNKSESKDKHKSDKSKHHKDRRKDKEKQSSSSSSNSSSHKHKEKEKGKERRDKDKKRDKDKESKKDEKRRKSVESKSSTDADATVEDIVLSDLDFEDDEDDTMMECYKIFNEYKPPPEEPVKEKTQPQENEVLSVDVPGTKKRIAHGNNDARNIFNKRKISPNPALVMANRFKTVIALQASNEGKNIINEVKQNIPIKRPAVPSLLEAAKKHKLLKTAKPNSIPSNPNLVDSILNGSKLKPRIAPVQNVNSIQRAKAKIEELAKQKAAQTLSKTPAQNVKGIKRVAHVPDYSLSNIPDVINADNSKLPVNVRTRYLTMIADECIKMYLNKEDSYNRALNEEFACYEKCKVIATYRNSAMLAVSRLRKEQQEREKQGLGLYECADINSGKTDQLKGKQFYNNIKQYIMTDEELDIHGYPRQSTIPGHAIIKNKKNLPKTNNLKANQRRCSRCSKIYLVDADGYVMFKEDCLYHPLKKRTLRGESTYLCCKSNDDTGCVTSNSHVCEMSEEAELEGYQRTHQPDNDNDPRSYAVYALDCEMCYTVKGLELTRVTIVDIDCKTVYETLVKPLNPIIDYNTNFSGITKEQMDKTSTSILQVQANILHLCNSNTVLIGHSLESDMKALKIIHNNIIDTSVLFPHKMGLPHKRALRVLASEFLKKIIQNDINGHDSAEDAITCMELVKWKLKEDLKVRAPK